MDQRIIYPGAVPQDTDLLLAQKYAKLGMGRLMDLLYGTQTAALGFAVTLSSSALSVTLGTGIVLTRALLLPTALGGEGGGIAADGTEVMSQFLLESPVSLTFPGTGGTYTLYATCVDADTDLTLLPFYNVAQPDQTQAGPNNSGNSLAVRRNAGITLSLAQSAPTAPTNGFVIPLITFTVPSGATNASGVTYAQIANTFWMTIPEIQNLLIANEPGRFLGSQVITADSSYTIPTGAKLLKVRGVAPGGAGGYAQGGGSGEGAGAAAGAGGAGAYAEFEMDLTKFPSLTTIPLTVGVAGVPTNTTISGSATNATFNGTDVVLGGGKGGYCGPTTTTPLVNACATGGTVTFNSSLYKDIASVDGAVGPSGIYLTNMVWPGLGVGTPLGSGGPNAAVGVGGAGTGFGASGSGAGSAYGYQDYLGGAGAPGCWIIEAYS